MEEMKSNEVRIGNLIEHDGGYFKIHSITPEFPFLDSIEFGHKVVTWDNIKAITLSEDILIYACGFKKEKDFLNKEGVKLWYDGNTFYHINSEMLTHIDFVHELQNWFYANTKEELIINLTPSK